MTAAQPTWSPVDHDAATLLDLLADDGAPILSPAEEWSAFTATLRFVARHHGGVVSANVMRELGKPPRTIHHWISIGRLDATKIGTGLTSAYVITRAEVERLKAEGAA